MAPKKVGKIMRLHSFPARDGTDPKPDDINFHFAIYLSLKKEVVRGESGQPAERPPAGTPGESMIQREAPPGPPLGSIAPKPLT